MLRMMAIINILLHDLDRSFAFRSPFDQKISIFNVTSIKNSLTVDVAELPKSRNDAFITGLAVDVDNDL